MFRNILLASDGSQASLHAARLALDLARVHSASLLVVYVVDPYPFIGIGEVNPMGFDAYMGAARQKASEAYRQVADLARSLQHSQPVEELTVEEVSASEGIVKTAQDRGADLIVIGSHGRSGVARLVMGSVAHKVVSQSPVPVLVSR